MPLKITEADRILEIRRARVQLTVLVSLFGIIIKDMDFAPAINIEYISTDGKTIYYNPDYIDIIHRLSIEGKLNEYNEKVNNLIWQLAHISIHLGFGHLIKKDNQEKWNLACDIFADNIISKYCSLSDDRMFNGPYTISINMKQDYKDKDIDTLYKMLLYTNKKYYPVIDNHYMWDLNVGNSYAIKANFAFNFWNYNLSEEMQKIASYIKDRLPVVDQDKIESLNLMQILSGTGYLKSYAHLSDNDLILKINDLASRPPEDFAIIAARIIQDNELRKAILYNPIWTKAAEAHKQYIL